MFELLAFIKRAGVSNSAEVDDCIQKCSQHYGEILEQEEGRQQALLENIQGLAEKCVNGIEAVRDKIEKLFQQQTDEVNQQKEVNLSKWQSRAQVALTKLYREQKSKEKDLYAKKMDTRVTELMVRSSCKRMPLFPAKGA